MKILMVHNFYQNRGGEAISFRAEADLLEERGHSVVRYTRDNEEIEHYNCLEMFQLSLNTIWSRKSFKDFDIILNKEKPDLVHFQNTFPLISHSPLDVCKRHHIPVVMTLHNYRMMCLNALFLRNNRICEDCFGKLFKWPGITHACYRSSHFQSAVVALMNAYYRMRRTWIDCVNTFICVSDFSKEKYIQAGLLEEYIRVVPNFMADPGCKTADGDFAVFVGRLSPEKGVQNLLEAAGNNPSIHLKIIGSGPLEETIIIASENLENVSALGWVEHDQMIPLLQKARFLVCPSILYETFGRVVMEAYACGVPVIGSRIGAIEELVHDGVTGLLVNPADAEDLSVKMKWLWDHPEEARQMGKNAREFYLAHLTPDAHYESLIQIYASVLEEN